MGSNRFPVCASACASGKLAALDYELRLKEKDSVRLTLAFVRLRLSEISLVGNKGTADENG